MSWLAKNTAAAYLADCFFGWELADFCQIRVSLVDASPGLNPIINVNMLHPLLNKKMGCTYLNSRLGYAWVPAVRIYLKHTGHTSGHVCLVCRDIAPVRRTNLRHCRKCCSYKLWKNAQTYSVGQSVSFRAVLFCLLNVCACVRAYAPRGTALVWCKKKHSDLSDGRADWYMPKQWHALIVCWAKIHGVRSFLFRKRESRRITVAVRTKLRRMISIYWSHNFHANNSGTLKTCRSKT